MATKPKQKEYENRYKRMNSFSNYPKSHLAKEEFVNAGFYYVGTEGQDDVKCYSCGLRMFDLTKDIDPIIEHKKYRPNCRVVMDTSPMKSGDSNVQNNNEDNSVEINPSTTNKTELLGQNIANPILPSATANLQCTTNDSSLQIPPHMTPTNIHQQTENSTVLPVNMPQPGWKPGDPIPPSATPNLQSTTNEILGQIPPQITPINIHQQAENSTVLPVKMPQPGWKPGDPIPPSATPNLQSTTNQILGQIPPQITPINIHQQAENSTVLPVKMPQPGWKPGDPIPPSATPNLQSTTNQILGQIPPQITPTNIHQQAENSTVLPVNMPQPGWKPGDPIPPSATPNLQSTTNQILGQIPPQITPTNIHQQTENSTVLPVKMPQPGWKPGDPIPPSATANLQSTTNETLAQITLTNTCQHHGNSTILTVNMPQPAWKPGDSIPQSSTANIQSTTNETLAQITLHIALTNIYQQPKTGINPPVSVSQPTCKPGDPIPPPATSNLQSSTNDNSAQITLHITLTNIYQQPENGTNIPVSVPQPTCKPGD